MKRFLLVFVLAATMLYFPQASESADYKGWLQYASDPQHTSIALDRWDFNTFDKIAWNLILRPADSRSRNPVVGKGMMIIGDADKVYCLDVISGKILWTFDISAPVVGSCAIYDETVVAVLSNRIVALNIANGEVRWYNANAGEQLSSPTIWIDEDGNKSMYLTSIATQKGYAMKYNLITGRQAWSKETEWGAPGGMGVNTDYGYVGCASHYKVELLAEGYGGTEDSLDTNTQSFASTMAIDKYCLFTMTGGEVYALPWANKSKPAKIIDLKGMVFAPPSQWGQTLVLGSDKNELVRFDTNGKKYWEISTPGPVTDACTIMDEYVLVPVGDDGDGKSGVYIYKAENGEFVKHIPLSAEYVFQPVVAWGRMFVEYGSNEKYKKRNLACFGKIPRNPDMEPKLRIDGGKLTVEVAWRQETTRQVTLVNEGKVPLEMFFEGDQFLSSTQDKKTLNPKEKDTLRITVKTGNNRPGNYSGSLKVMIDDGEYGIRTLGTVTASIKVTEKAIEPPKEEPPKPPRNLTAKWVYDHVELDWDAPDGGSDVSGYDLYKALFNDAFPVTPINKTRISETNASDSAVAPGAKYKYRVVTVGKNTLQSDPSSEVSVEIPIKLEKVANLKAEKFGDDVMLSWESNQNVSFKLDRNGDQIALIQEKTYTDMNPPKELLIYKVFPVFGGKIGPEAYVILNLTPAPEPPKPDPQPDPKPDPEPDPKPEPPPIKKTVVVFTIGKATATVDGVEKNCNGTPYVKSGRTMVPFRFLGESIGAVVSFETEESGKVRSVKYAIGNKVVELLIGNSTALVDGNPVVLDAPPEIVGGRTFVPLRFVTAALGGGVSWDPSTKSATITYPQ